MEGSNLDGSGHKGLARLPKTLCALYNFFFRFVDADLDLARNHLGFKFHFGFLSDLQFFIFELLSLGAGCDLFIFCGAGFWKI